LLARADGPPLTTTEYGAMLGYSDDKVRLWIEAGDLFAYRDGGHGAYRIPWRAARQHARRFLGAAAPSRRRERST
jgi:excisionase family DNA binding protein